MEEAKAFMSEYELVKVNEHKSIMLVNVHDMEKMQAFMTTPEMQEWDKVNNCVSKILIIFGNARIVHLKLTVAEVSDLGAGHCWYLPLVAKGDKKFSKTVKNAKTGKKKTVGYGAKGYSIVPRTSKGDSYCTRSYGQMKKHPEASKNPNSSLRLSRAKWKCSR